MSDWRERNDRPAGELVVHYSSLDPANPFITHRTA